MLSPVGFVYFLEYRRKLSESLENLGRKVHGRGPVVSFRQDRACFPVSIRLLVRPRAPEGVVLVGKHGDPPLDRYSLSFQAAGVSGPVPPLMMIERDRRGHLDRSE